MDGPDGTLTQFSEWVGSRRPAPCAARRLRLRELRNWRVDARGNLRHASGRFFAVRGLRVGTGGDLRARDGWDQPILDQPEIGILGLLCQRRAGVLSFLVRAKSEPGNVGGAQLSPTLQATWSNYHRVHGGRTPPYLDEFLRPSGTVHVDQLQPEQGSRFLGKHNRNVVVQLPDDRDLPVQDGFLWCTLGQLRVALRQPNVVNAECRSVLACLPDATDEPVTAKSDSEIGSWLDEAARRRRITVQPCDVDELRDWAVDEWSISAPGGPFEVVGIRAHVTGRGVTTWDQPLLQPTTTGVVGFLTRVEHGVLHLLVQARTEAGAGRPTLGPTVQTSDPGALVGGARTPYLGWLQPTAAGAERYRALQSEEGGRFLWEQHLHVVVDVGGATVPVEEPYRWLPVNQVRSLVRQGQVSSQARSLLACVDAC